jgi:hypothetical protein
MTGLSMVWELRAQFPKYGNVCVRAFRGPGAAGEAGARGLFRKGPCNERGDAPLPASRPNETYPQRYGEGGRTSPGRMERLSNAGI